MLRAKAERNTRLAERQLADLRAAGADGYRIAIAELDCGRSRLGLDRAAARAELLAARAAAPQDSVVWLLATDILAWDHIGHGEIEPAGALAGELAAAGAAEDYLRWLTSRIALLAGQPEVAEQLVAGMHAQVGVLSHLEQ